MIRLATRLTKWISGASQLAWSASVTAKAKAKQREKKRSSAIPVDSSVLLAPIPMTEWLASSTGIPGPRLKFQCQHVEHVDEVMYDFPELTYVSRHGCQPWTELMVKLMLKWPGLHYSTSAFAPKHYDQRIIDYANTRGADKIMYAGYFPMGLSLQRIMTEMRDVPFNDNVWPKFLHDNAARVLKLD